MNSQKSKFLTMFLSLLPGAGHMYLGYMKRGCSFLVLFFGCFALSSLLHSVGFLIPIVWVYSFFDAYNLRTNYVTSGEINDEWICDVTDMRNKYKGKAPRYIGGGLIFIGFLSLWQSAIKYPLVDILERYNINTSFVYYIPTIVVCTVIILIGFKLAFGRKEG